jgi:type VI secretion system secreted protein VgrG
MTQKSLRYEIECAALGGAEVAVGSVRAVEALDAPYRVDVRVLVADPDLDPATLLGTDASVRIARGDHERRFVGLVRTVFDGGVEPARGLVMDLRIEPAFGLLALRRDTRMFQGKTAPEILEAVLGQGLAPYGRSVRLELSGSYATREYCLQYQETDLDFVQRLMEEEGIAYSFDFAEDTEVLVLRDANRAYPAVESLSSPLQLHVDDLYVRDAEPVHSFATRLRHTTTSVVIADWDWTKQGDMGVTAESRGTDAQGRDRESYEHGLFWNLQLWDYATGSRRYQKNEATPQSALRRDAAIVDALVADGTSRVIGLSAGVTFELVGHPTVGVDGEYLVTRVVHESTPPPQLRGGTAETERYHNRFECIPIAVTHRPKRRTPKPRIASIQTAVVTGPAGEEIHVDEHGRIKVQFHWDRENPADETSSCWVRCQQVWAGDGWGFWWVPRIGMEVVVSFVDGDPDRPLVTGAVYDGTNGTPYPLPDEKTKSTIKSNSSLGGGGFNEFRFEDKAGSEEIYTHAQKDYNEVVENDHNTLVHNNQTNTVDVDQTQVIGANQTETVHGNQEMTVDGNRTVHVKSNFDETVDGTETRHVAGNVTETFDSNEERTISGNVTETISGNETRTISGSQSETITGSQTATVSGSDTQTITGSLSQTITGGVTSTTPAAHTISAVGGFNITAAAGIKMLAPAGFKMVVPGGVTQLDSFYDWTGIKQTEVGVLATAVTGLKIEAAAISMGATAVKFEDVGAEIAGTLVKTAQTVAAMRKSAAYLRNSALGLYMYGVSLLP